MCILPFWSKLFTILGIVTTLRLCGQPGAVDTSFDPGSSVGFGVVVQQCVVQDDGMILMAGGYGQYQGVPRGGLVRIHPNGLIDLSYDPPLLYSPGLWSVTAIAIDQGGGCIVGGSLYISGLGTRRLIRLHVDGTLDIEFDQNLGSGPNHRVDNIALQGNGDIIIGGPFTNVNGAARMGLAELHSDGSLNIEQSFEGGVNDSPLICKVGSDDCIYITGLFTHYGLANQEVHGIVKIHPDGSLAQCFELAGGVEFGIIDFIVEESGSVLISGSFDEGNEVQSHLLARVLPNGDVDTTFNYNAALVGTLASRRVCKIISDGSDGYLALGWMLDGSSALALVNLNANGELYPDFAGPAMNSVYSQAYDLRLVPNGNILVLGPFSYCGEIARNRVALVHSRHGTAIWQCLNNPALTLPANDAMLVEADVGEWCGFEVEQCMQVVVRTCDMSGADQFGDGLYTSCPAYPDSIIPFDAPALNDCGGMDWTIEGLEPGTYWLAPEGSGGPYSFTIHTTLCGPIDCLEVPGGSDLPGTPCDDGDDTTIDDLWSVDCNCAGTLDLNWDCNGIPEGPSQPGTPCNDGVLWSTNDAWTDACVCAGLDCAGVQGGNAFPGTPCDDLDPNTLLDEWSVECVCGTATGINETDRDAFGVQVRPNPCAADHFDVTLSREFNASVSVRVFDATMRLVHAEVGIRTGSIPVQVDRSRIPAGSYFLEVQVQQERVMHRLILQ